MSVYVLALNPEREILFRFKCLSAVEGRGIITRLSKCFSHCLSNIALCHRVDDHLLFNKDAYKTIKNFTYEQNKYWYIARSNYDL